MIKRLGVVLVLLLAVVTLADAQQKPLRPFTFILDFLPYGEYTPYFTALDKGWYRDEGLDVKILRIRSQAGRDPPRLPGRLHPPGLPFFRFEQHRPPIESRCPKRSGSRSPRSRSCR